MYPVDDDLIARLEFARGYLCKQMIYYKEKEIDAKLVSGLLKPFMEKTTMKNNAA